jgi:hypothetical protein
MLPGAQAGWRCLCCGPRHRYRRGDLARRHSLRAGPVREHPGALGPLGGRVIVRFIRHIDLHPPLRPASARCRVSGHLREPLVL